MHGHCAEYMRASGALVSFENFQEMNTLLQGGSTSSGALSSGQGGSTSSGQLSSGQGGSTSAGQLSSSQGGCTSAGQLSSWPDPVLWEYNRSIVTDPLFEAGWWYQHKEDITETSPEDNGQLNEAGQRQVSQSSAS